MFFYDYVKIIGTKIVSYNDRYFSYERNRAYDFFLDHFKLLRRT